MAVATRADVDAWDSAGLPPIAAAGGLEATVGPGALLETAAGVVAGALGASWGVFSTETVAMTTEEGWLPPEEPQASASEQKSNTTSGAVRIDS